LNNLVRRSLSLQQFSSLEPQASPKENEAQRFARQLARLLEAVTNKAEFDAPVRAAPPRIPSS
jgi:Protein required for attachment to host cells